METVLEFRGWYAAGAGFFSQQISLPGCRTLAHSIPDWPAKLYPGTLNVRLSTDGFPPTWATRFDVGSIKGLDSRAFRPIAEILGSDIRGNQLTPTPASPSRGNAQIWAASLIAKKRHTRAECWVLRRIGSGYAQVLELVSGEQLSAALGLVHDDEVTILMRGSWV